MPPLTQLRSYVTKKGRVGAQIFCFFFLYPHCLTSPLWEDHTILNLGEERSKSVLFLWPSTGLSPFGSLMWHVSWDLRPICELDMNLVFSSSPPEAKINFLEICFLSRATLDIQGFLRSSVVFLAHFHVSSVATGQSDLSRHQCDYGSTQFILTFPRPSLLVHSLQIFPMMLLWSSHLAVTSQAEHLTSTAPGTQPREQLGPCACLAERKPHNTGHWGPAAVHQWRGTHCLFKDTEWGSSFCT